MSDSITREELRVALQRLADDINKANAALQNNDSINELLVVEQGELLLSAIQRVGHEQLAVVGLLIEKGIITSMECEAKQAEIAAQWQVETALDPNLAAVTEMLSQMRERIKQIKATLRKDLPRCDLRAEDERWSVMTVAIYARKSTGYERTIRMVDAAVRLAGYGKTR